MTTVYAIAMIAVAAVCTFATRVAPFLLFNGSNAAVPPQKELALAAGGGVPYHRGRCSTRKDSDVIL